MRDQPMSHLSEHFTLEELVRSQTALRLGLDNAPPVGVVGNLQDLCAKLLEPARALWGVPVHVSSGYRSIGLNEYVGGSPTSAHVVGLAADLVPAMDLQRAFDLLRHSDLPFDQVIYECRAWIHLALPCPGTAPRKQALTASGGPGAWRYQLVSHG